MDKISSIIAGKNTNHKVTCAVRFEICDYWNIETSSLEHSQTWKICDHQRVNKMGVIVIPVIFQVKQPRLIKIAPYQVQIRIIIKIIKRNAVSAMASWCPDNLNIFKIIRNKFKLWARISIPLACVISQSS